MRNLHAKGDAQGGALSRPPADLPPLDLLVAFEAAARHLSFTLAGEEMALTQSAVSRQIKALEDRLGVQLFRRRHRSLVLTEEAGAFYRAVVAALDGLERATRELRGAGRVKSVIVTTTAGFASLWLIPRLASFVAAHPGVDVRISASHALVNLERDGVDVAVRYRAVDGRTASRGDVLFGETVFPVCSPRLSRDAARPLQRPADLAKHTLLRMEPDGGNHLQDWGLWLHAMQLTALQPAGVLHFSSYDQLVQAAEAGHGVALGRSPLIDRLLKSRRLMAPFASKIASPHAYCMMVSDASAAKPEVRAFTTWLANEARRRRA